MEKYPGLRVIKTHACTPNIPSYLSLLRVALPTTAACGGSVSWPPRPQRGHQLCWQQVALGLWLPRTSRDWFLERGPWGGGRGEGGPLRWKGRREGLVGRELLSGWMDDVRKDDFAVTVTLPEMRPTRLKGDFSPYRQNAPNSVFGDKPVQGRRESINHKGHLPDVRFRQRNLYSKSDPHSDDSSCTE